MVPPRESMKKKVVKSWNFIRFHEIPNSAFAENFSCLSHWEVRNQFYQSNAQNFRFCALRTLETIKIGLFNDKLRPGKFFTCGFAFQFCFWLSNYYCIHLHSLHWLLALTCFRWSHLGDAPFWVGTPNPCLRHIQERSSLVHNQFGREQPKLDQNPRLYLNR